MKIGIVGGHGHLVVQASPRAIFAWAGDGFDQKAHERARTRGDSLLFADFDSMVAEFQPEIIYVGSYYAHNGAITVQALEQGFNVICEKPIAADQATLHKIRELTASTGLNVIGEYAMRWNPTFHKVRTMVANGAIGAPVMVQAQKTYKFGASRPDFYRRRETFGGIIPWVASHAIDYASWCSGLRYRSVTATHGNQCFPEYPGMEDHAAMFYEMENGVPCVITADFLRPAGATTHGDDRLRITGESGILEVLGQEVLLTNAQGVTSWKDDGSQDINQQRAEDMIESVLGRSTSMLTTEASLHMTSAALAARDSADAHGQSGQLTPMPVAA